MFLRCMWLQSVVAGNQQQPHSGVACEGESRNATLEKRIFEVHPARSQCPPFQISCPRLQIPIMSSSRREYPRWESGFTI
jgi:hypothetical protein